MQKMRFNVWVLCGVAAILAGCTTYYKVNDPAGTKEYYTKKIKETDTGSISFKDEKTGGHVRLQSSEVKEISKEEYNAAVKGEMK